MAQDEEEEEELGPDVATPLELALFSPVHLLHGDRKLVAGLEINIIYGETWRNYGVQLGVISHTIDAQVGLQVGVVQIVDGEQVGLQLGVVNVTEGPVTGISVGALWGHQGGGCRGICLSPIGNSSSHAVIPLVGEWREPGTPVGGGIMVGGLFNFIGGEFGGLMISAFANFSAYAYGLQLSLWNTALLGFAGIQIGLANVDGSLLTDSHDEGLYTVSTRESFREAWADGILVGAFFNATQRSRGLAISVANFAATRHEGLQLASFNFSGDTDRNQHGFLVQLGGVNVAGDFAVLQMGIINAVSDQRSPGDRGAVPFQAPGGAC